MIEKFFRQPVFRKAFEIAKSFITQELEAIYKDEEEITEIRNVF